MRIFTMFFMPMFLLTSNLRSGQSNEQFIYKFCEDVWVSKKKDEQIISEYLIPNTSKDVSDLDRNSYIKPSLDELRKLNLTNSMRNIRVQPYSRVQSIAGLDEESMNTNNIYAVTKDEKVLAYILLDHDRIASFTILKQGKRSYFLVY